MSTSSATAAPAPASPDKPAAAAPKPPASPQNSEPNAAATAASVAAAAAAASAEPARYQVMGASPRSVEQETQRLIAYSVYQGNGSLDMSMEPVPATTTTNAPSAPSVFSSSVAMHLHEPLQRLVAALPLPLGDAVAGLSRQGQTKITVLATLNSIRKSFTCTFSFPPSAPDDVVFAFESASVQATLLVSRARAVSICVRFAAFSTIAPPQSYTAQELMYQQQQQYYMQQMHGYRGGGGGGGGGGMPMYYGPGVPPGAYYQPAPTLIPVAASPAITPLLPPQAITAATPAASATASTESDARPSEGGPHAQALTKRFGDGFISMMEQHADDVLKAMQLARADKTETALLAWLVRGIDFALPALLAHANKSTRACALAVCARSVEQGEDAAHALAGALLAGGAVELVVTCPDALIELVPKLPAKTAAELALKLRPVAAELACRRDAASCVGKLATALGDAWAARALGGMCSSARALSDVACDATGSALLAAALAESNPTTVKLAARTLGNHPSLAIKLGRDAKGSAVLARVVLATPKAGGDAFEDFAAALAARAHALAQHASGVVVVEAGLKHPFYRRSVASRLFGAGVNDLVASAHGLAVLDAAVNSESDLAAAAAWVQAVVEHDALMPDIRRAHWAKLAAGATTSSPMP